MLYETKTQKTSKTRLLVYYAILIALSFVGAQIKIMGSIALDALPAYFAALLLGSVAGAVVGAIGHLLTALTSGFPMTVPVHILLMVAMAAICWLMGYLNGKINIILNCIIAIFLNGVGATYLSVLVMQVMGTIPSANAMFLTLVGPLVLASTVNVVGAAVLYQLLKGKIRV